MLYDVSKEECDRVSLNFDYVGHKFDPTQGVLLQDAKGEDQGSISNGYTSGENSCTLVFTGNGSYGDLMHYVGLTLAKTELLGDAYWYVAVTARGKPRNISGVATCNVEVKFDPDSEVTIGGFQTKTDGEGEAQFLVSVAPARASSGTCIAVSSRR